MIVGQNKTTKSLKTFFGWPFFFFFFCNITNMFQHLNAAIDTVIVSEWLNTWNTCLPKYTMSNLTVFSTVFYKSGGNNAPYC